MPAFTGPWRGVRHVWMQPVPAGDGSGPHLQPASVLGSTMGDMDEFRSVMALFKDGTLQPIIDSVHDVDDAASAWGRLESSDHFGKVAIRWS